MALVLSSSSVVVWLTSRNKEIETNTSDKQTKRDYVIVVVVGWKYREMPPFSIHLYLVDDPL